MRDFIEMAREAGFETMITKGKIHGFDRDGDYTEELKDFEALVRADEREQGQKWFDAVTAQHKQEILAEREACAKVCDEYDDEYDVHTKQTIEGIAMQIRARGNT
jgi:hypothetical protein